MNEAIPTFYTTETINPLKWHVSNTIEEANNMHEKWYGTREFPHIDAEGDVWLNISTLILYYSEHDQAGMLLEELLSNPPKCTTLSSDEEIAIYRKFELEKKINEHC